MHIVIWKWLVDFVSVHQLVIYQYLILGFNQRTGISGDFPGANYAVFFDEVIPQPEPPPPPPPKDPSPPTPPPRQQESRPPVPSRRRAMSPTSPNNNQPWSGTPPPVTPRREPLSAFKREHDLFKVTVQLPLLCVVCELRLFKYY